jgi:hypothetical protein
LNSTLLVHENEVRANAMEYGMHLVEKCRAGLPAVLPFTNARLVSPPKTGPDHVRVFGKIHEQDQATAPKRMRKRG